MLGDVSAIYYRPCNVRSELPRKTGHCIRPVAAERRTALDFAKRCLLAILQDKIDFVSVGVAIVVYLGMPAFIGNALETLPHNHSLEEFPAKRMRGYLRTVGYAEKIARKSDVQKIELWRLDKTLAYVRMPRLQHAHNIACFKQRQPLRRNFRGNARVIRQRRHVQHSACPSRSQSEKYRKRTEVLHVLDFPDIAVQIGVDVERKRIRGV